MDLYCTFINLITGAIGGYIVGQSLNSKSPSPVVSSILGLIGGILTVYILQAKGILDIQAFESFNPRSIIGTLASSLAGGAVLTLLVTLIKHIKNKGSSD